MTREELFQIWAPETSPWSAWAKPVLFAYVTTGIKRPRPETNLDVAGALPDLPRRTAVVVDTPGESSVWLGLALAKKGLRPVPLYNACRGPSAMVEVDGIMQSLSASAPELQALSISPDAPPAFLLDAHRMAQGRIPSEGRFDNRWLVMPQDMPSVVLLKEAGIRDVLLVLSGAQRPASDLAHILCRWQEGGLSLSVLDVAAKKPAPSPLKVVKPSWYRHVLYRAFALIGLRRHSAGGFGDFVPLPSSSGGGGYYGSGFG